MPVGQPQNYIGDRNNLAVDSAGNLLFRRALNSVWRYLNTSGLASGTTGLVSSIQALLLAKNSDGSILAVNGAQAAGNFGIVSTPGTALRLMGETATSNTKTDTVIIEASVGNGYVAGQTVPVVVNANLSAANTSTVKTVGVSAWVINNDGSQTVVAVTAPASVTMTAAATDFTFTLAAANLAAGGRILIRVTTTITETTATAVASQVNSIRLG